MKMNLAQRLLIALFQLNVIDKYIQSEDGAQALHDIRGIIRELPESSQEMLEIESQIQMVDRENYHTIDEQKLADYKRYNLQLGHLQQQIESILFHEIDKIIKSETLRNKLKHKFIKQLSSIQKSTDFAADFANYQQNFTAGCDNIASYRERNQAIISLHKEKFAFYKSMIAIFFEQDFEQSGVTIDLFTKIHSDLIDIDEKIKLAENHEQQGDPSRFMEVIKELSKQLDSELANLLRGIACLNPRIKPTFIMNEVTSLEPAVTKLSELSQYRQALINVTTKIQNDLATGIYKAGQELVDTISSEKQAGAMWSLRDILNDFKEGDFIYGLSQGRSHLVGILDPNHDNMTISDTGDLNVSQLLMIDDLNHGFLGTGHYRMLQDHLAKGVGEFYNPNISQSQPGLIRQFHEFLVSQNRNIGDTAGPEYSQDRIKFACKKGVYFVTKELKNNIHFILDGIDMNMVANKTGPRDRVIDPVTGKPNRDITGAELRFIFRNQNDFEMMSHVKFWHKGKLVPPPWETQPEIWTNYRLKHNIGPIAEKMIDKQIEKIQLHLQASAHSAAATLKLNYKIRQYQNLKMKVQNAVRKNKDDVDILNLFKNYPKLAAELENKLNRNRDLAIIARNQENLTPVSIEDIKTSINSLITPPAKKEEPLASSIAASSSEHRARPVILKREKRKIVEEKPRKSSRQSRKPRSNL
ncbi:hypothetical protein [Candidatus Berkiella aquae]|uniref:Uncharacterized protein n=1 Tax=Candidatus Berkiella aquae TaxID=295108 RepID=A0A0Q9YJF9_9GAMM|nr:hypothetical protein [Candidatus Berkiella aquae]MCS5711259.1 hypothetical protein [Candidatus Berkiella aquae]